LIDTTDVAEARGERVRVGQVAADDVDAAQSAVGPPLPLRDDGERVSATTLDALPPVGVKWEHAVPSRHVRERLWRSQAQVELATVTWVAWFNHQRLHSSLGDIPPVEFEQNHARVALNASIPCNGSVAGIPSNAADGLTTRRAWTLGVDFAGDRPISPRTVALLAAGPAQAGPQAGQGGELSAWPLRRVGSDQSLTD
jgi:hypothetical protein